MPILIKGSGGATASSFGYTEQYDENDTEHVSFVPEDRQIIIKPRDSATNYGLSSITGFANFCIRIKESDEASETINKVVTLSWGVGNAIRKGYYLYVREFNDETMDFKGQTFVASYDKAAGALTITADPLREFNDGNFDLYANVTWEIN